MGSLLVVVGQQSEPSGGITPHPLEVGLDRLESLLVEVVDPPGALGLLGHEASMAQESEVARDSWPADRHGVSQLRDGFVPLAQQAEDLPAVGVAERLERVACGYCCRRHGVTHLAQRAPCAV